MDKRKKIYLLIGTLALLGALMYRFSPSFGEIGPSDDAILLKEKEVAKYKRIVAERSTYEAKLVSLNKKLAERGTGLLSGNTPALAAVDIQNSLSAIATQIDVEVKTMQVMKAEKQKNSDYLNIPVQIRIYCTIGQLKDFLYKIEGSQKYLRVTSMRINTRVIGKTKNKISTFLTVEGIMKSRGGRA
jgi:hypothetical protein